MPDPDHRRTDAAAAADVDDVPVAGATQQPDGDAPAARFPLEALTDGGMTRCLHRGQPVLLCRLGPVVHAVDDRCTHEDVSLSLGSLSGHCLRCPLHGAVFDVRDGSVLAEPATRALRRWPTRVDDGWVIVGDLATPG